MSLRSSDPTDELPGWVESMWRALKLGYRAEPRLLVIAFVTTVAAAIPDALFALGLKFFAEGAIAGDRTRLVMSALFLGGLATGGWVLQTMSERVNRRFSDRATITIESHVAHLQASVAGIEHHERPEYLDRLAEQQLTTASKTDRDGRPVLLVAVVKSFDPVIARRVALAALKRAGVDARRIGHKHIEALLDLAEPPGNREIHLPGKLTARRVRGEIRFGPRLTR